ncbi:MAG: hypothetical protein JXB34_14585 [Bacteroidales bacterium]|nr:hypothetical protein [Bacteroidales bacterium]
MKTLLYLLVSAMFFVCFSCEKDVTGTHMPDLSVEPVYLEPSYFGKCFGGLIVNDTAGIIIRSDKQYQALGDSCRMLWLSSVMCDTATLPEIDFRKYSLIGKYTSGSGCSVTKAYSLHADTINKTYVYSIHRHYEGTCEMIHSDMNWALVPAIPQDYRVVFIVLRE